MEDKQIKKFIQEYSLKHIAMIMDGNGRWAQKRDLKRTEGHKEGALRVVEIAEACSDFGVEVISLYAFSTENWKRPISEVKAIFDLLNKFITEYLDRLHENNAKIVIMGDISKLNIVNQTAINHAMNKTKNNTGLIINIGINYGAKDELLRASKKIIDDVQNNKIFVKDMDENTISKYLDTKGLPDIDLLIRTGGDQRLSNFMLYQLAYAELLFIDALWPDFNKDILKDCIVEFLKRDRRYGGLNE